jgi:anti-anti-sigma factor
MDAFLSSSDESRLHVTARGEADLATAGDLLVRLVTLVGAAAGEVAIDLSQVTFMDCAGLRTLNAIERLVRVNGGSVQVVAASPAVARLFELVGPRWTPPHLFAPTALAGPTSTLTSQTC